MISSIKTPFKINKKKSHLAYYVLCLLVEKYVLNTVRLHQISIFNLNMQHRKQIKNKKSIAEQCTRERRWKTDNAFKLASLVLRVD